MSGSTMDQRWVSEARLDDSEVVAGGTGVTAVDADGTLDESLVLVVSPCAFKPRLCIDSRSLRI